MKIYFLSSRPCALRLGGVFFGVTDTFERFAEVSLKDNLFVEFIPDGALPIVFFLTDEVRFHPPVGCEVYLLRDAIALYACDFPPAECALRPITQQRQGDLLATVFLQGRVHLSLQTAESFFTDTLPYSFTACEISFHSGLVLIHSPTQLAVYTKTGERLLLEQIHSFAVEENVLRARLPLSDRLSRFADCAWELSETACTRTEFTLCQARNEENELPADLVAYAFFESVLIGADYTQWLCEDLREKADELLSFLGEFEGVVLGENACECGLVQQKSERLYEILYARVTVEDGKITDIST